MTSRPRACIIDGAPAVPGTSRCPKHTRSNWAKRSSGLGWGWTKIRQGVLAEEPNCRVCGARATFVDHIINRAEGGTHDRANLQPLCARCHQFKTQEEARRGQRRKRGYGDSALGPT
jgi:5-methylcytosine-specific restriction protein A